MPVGGEEVDRGLRDVDRQGAEPLDRVDEQGDPAPLAGRAEQVEVVPEAGGELDVADRQDPRPIVHRRKEVVDQDPAFLGRYGPRLDPS